METMPRHSQTSTHSMTAKNHSPPPPPSQLGTVFAELHDRKKATIALQRCLQIQGDHEGSFWSDPTHLCFSILLVFLVGDTS